MTITSKSKWIPSELSEKTVSLFLKINEKISPIHILIKNDYLPMIKDLKGEMVIGLETNQWIYKKDDLDIFINVGGELINDIKNACAQ